MVDNIQSTVFGRQQGIENELNDHRAKIQEIETVVVKNVTQANRTVESELSRFEKIISAFEKYIDNQIVDIKDQTKAYFDDAIKMKRGEGAEEDNKYDEIKTTLNLISHSMSQIEEDNKDRGQLLKAEVKATEGAMSQQI